MRTLFTSNIFLSSCILLLLSLMITAKLNSHKHIVISRIAKNAKAMGVTGKVVHCLARELPRFEYEWTPNSKRDLITKAHFEEVASKSSAFARCSTLVGRRTNLMETLSLVPFER